MKQKGLKSSIFVIASVFVYDEGCVSVLKAV